ncbi:uncharacterized protein LOC121838117, partial [Ixodes scapularis]|uniref:uncharacterized protein LOC121838117 n=1 Tax=Ixodes scapularis TaxID=6945 RepID=UPI001A9DDEA5
MTAENVNAWNSNTCKLPISRQYEMSDERGPAEGERATSSGSLELNVDKLLPTNEAIYKKLTDILNRMESVEKSLEKQSRKDDEIMTKLDAHGKTVEAIDASMSTLSGKCDELLKRLDEQCATIKELTKRTGQLEAKVAEQDLQIRELKIAVDNAEQYSRRKNIEIHGIAQRPNENMLEVVKNLADKLELPQLAPEDVEAAHRLGAREGKTAPILVRFVERRTRDHWMTKRVTLRNEKIYINENLTKTLKNLLWATK